MKQLLLLVAVYALILNQSNRHFFKKDKAGSQPVPVLTKSTAQSTSFPPRLAVTAMITRFAAMSMARAQQ